MRRLRVYIYIYTYIYIRAVIKLQNCCRNPGGGVYKTADDVAGTSGLGEVMSPRRKIRDMTWPRKVNAQDKREVIRQVTPRSRGSGLQLRCKIISRRLCVSRASREMKCQLWRR